MDFLSVSINMPQPVPSTYHILKEKVLNRHINESWANWAQEMMEAGFESVNLYELAGTTKICDQFELVALSNTVLNELHLDYSDTSSVIRNYVCFIIKACIDNVTNYLPVLREIKNIYLELDMDSEYQDFYLLYFAKDDLTDSEVQWYWPDGNRDNIDSIIGKRFRAFIDSCDLKS